MSDPGDSQSPAPLAFPTSLERWALFAQIVGALAVVLSVVYLALQVSDNNRLLRSQAHYNGLVLTQRPLEIMIDSQDLAGILAECDAHPESVDRTSWYRCSGYYLLQFNGWEYLYYQSEDGSIPLELWNGADASFRHRVATRPGYARFWSELSLAFDEPFRSYVAGQFTPSE